MAHEHDHSKDECSGGCACCDSDILENIDEEKEQSKKPLIIFIIGIVIIAIGYLLQLFTKTPIVITQIIYLIAVIIVGKNIIIYGVKQLTHRKIKIQLLVTIATIGAFFLSSGEEGALLMTLFYLGEYIEEYSLNKSKSSLVKLVKLTPDKAMVKHGDHHHEKETSEINVGDVVIVKPGDKIPVDGVIIKGQSSINQSSITGESIPVAKSIDDEVYASTINEEGYLEIKVTKESENTIFAKIIELIKNSEENKAPIDLFIDKFAEVYTPIIIVLAILVAIIPTLLGQSIYTWTYRALTLLVIACPCALVISTPVSIVSAITKGTKNGIIIKGGEFIEELSRVKEILFDKTGTLTKGNLKIDEIIEYSNYSKEDIIKIACSIEEQSNHPIAKAFNKYRKTQGIELLNVIDFKSIAGKGVEGTINNIKYKIGKRNMFNDDVKADKGTEVIAGTEKEVLGLIRLSDELRDESKDTINNLKKLGIKTAMITGDNNETASKIASKLDLDNYYSDLLPEDKVKIVEKSVTKYGDVAMVGDGVNDTPSLAIANVGIAMGLDGADVAIETADVVLLEDNLSKINLLINLAQKTMGKIKFNVIFCIAVKIFLILLGIGGFINLWEAVLVGDMGVTFIVVGNSLLLAK